MPKPDQSTVRNRLLTAISAEAFATLRPHMETVDLPVRHVLVEADQPTDYVCFIESGLGSVVAVSSDDESVEVGHVGREGLTGFHVLLATNRTPNRTFMQVAGFGIQMPVPAFLSALKTDPALHDLFLRYVHSCQVQLAHSALANARYSMHERLARWLLMCHDRLDGSDLALTHEFLALMLGVRRSGVTNELHIIEGVGAIKAKRGNIRILSRPQLEEMAGGCYGLPEREYERLIGFAINPSRASKLIATR
jgi:CRP-like cAMP-binding protein